MFISFAAQGGTVDGGCRFLDGSDVVDVFPLRVRVGILEDDAATGFAGRAREDPPWVFDQFSDGIFGVELFADADHFDLLDSSSRSLAAAGVTLDSEGWGGEGTQ